MAWGTELQVEADYATTDGLQPGLYVGRTGDIFTSATSEATGALPAFTGRKSTDSGASFSTVTNPNIAGGGLAGCLHFPWHDNANETICYYGSWAVDNAGIVDYDDDYWLTQEFAFDFSITSSGNDSITPEIDLDQAHAGAVGILVDWAATTTGGAGNLQTRANGDEWQSGVNYVFTGSGAATDSDMHVFINPESAASAFPSYKEQADGPPNLTTLRSRDSLRILMGGNFGGGGSMTFNGTARLIILKSLETFPGGDFTATLYRANGTTRTDITPTDSSARRYTARGQRAIHSADNNRLRLALAGCTGLADSDPTAVFLSPDGGDSWVQVGDIDETGGRYKGCHVSENGQVYVWGDDEIAIGTWNDLITGGGFDSRAGNLSNVTVVNIIGG